jgi:hypothetical protein
VTEYSGRKKWDICEEKELKSERGKEADKNKKGDEYEQERNEKE